MTITGDIVTFDDGTAARISAISATEWRENADRPGAEHRLHYVVDGLPRKTCVLPDDWVTLDAAWKAS